MSILFIFIQNNSPQKRLKRLPPNLWYKVRLNRQWNCWSLSCSWSIACRRCTNYIFVLDLIPGFNGLEFGASYIRGLTVRASIIIKPCIVYSFQYPMSCKVTLNRKYGHKFRFWLYQKFSFRKGRYFYDIFLIGCIGSCWNDTPLAISDENIISSKWHFRFSEYNWLNDIVVCCKFVWWYSN